MSDAIPTTPLPGPGEAEPWLGAPGSLAGPPRPLFQLFAEQAARSPRKAAVTGEGGALTWRDLARKASRLARFLVRIGVGPEEPVAVCLDPDVDLPVALLGVLAAGGACLPLDPASPSVRRAAAVRTGRPAAVLTRSGLADDFAGCGGRVVLLDLEAAEIGREAPEAPEVHVEPGQAAWLVEAEGRLLVLEHRAVAARIDRLQSELALESGDLVLHGAPADGDAAAWEILWPLLTGARLALAGPAARTGGGALLRAAGQLGATVVHLTPAALREALESGATPPCGLRWALCGGEPLAPALATAAAERLGPTAPLWELIAAPEAGGEILLRERGVDEGARPAPTWSMGAADLYILDRALDPLPVGIAGEIHAGGDALARGFLDDPAATALRFLPDPWTAEPGGRMVATGLTGRLASGGVELADSAAGRVRLRGHLLDLAAAEEVLRRHPAVEDCALRARAGDDGVWRLVAYVQTAAPGARVEPAALAGHLEVALPPAVLPPVCIPVSELPRTPSGRVHEEALRRLRPAGERLEVVVTATFTARPLEDSLAFWLDEIGLPGRVRFAPYAQVFQELLQPDSLSARNREGADLFLIRLEDWAGEGETAARRRALEGSVGQLVDALRLFRRRNSGLCLIALCPPSERARADAELGAALAEQGERLLALAAELPGVCAFDAAEAVRLYGVTRVDDARADELGHIPYTPECFAALGTLAVRRLAARLTEGPRLLAVDGATAAALAPPARDVLRSFLQRQAELERETVLLGGGEPEVDGLRALAEARDARLAACAFLGSPEACAAVRAALPEALALPLPADPGELRAFLDHVWIFDAPAAPRAQVL